MTLTELTALPDAALNELAGYCLGWKKGITLLVRWVTKDNKDTGYCFRKDSGDPYFDPCNSKDHASLLETEIARRAVLENSNRLLNAYARELKRFCGSEFELITAPARLRTVAAVYVLQSEVKE